MGESLYLCSRLNQHQQCEIDVKLVSYVDNQATSSIVRAIIDTGSYYSFVKYGIIDKERINNTGKKIQYTLIGDKKGESDLYRCNLLIPALHSHSTFDFFFGLNESIYPGVQVVIGTGFLQAFILKYNHPKVGEFYLELLPPES